MLGGKSGSGINNQDRGISLGYGSARQKQDYVTGASQISHLHIWLLF